MSQKHFVTFYSPGTFAAETSEREIGEWDTREALRIANTITERYNARPYGFVFTTKESDGWQPKEAKRSPFHFINCEVQTLAEVDKGSILHSNMKNNNWPAVVSPKKGWRFTQPFTGDDVIVDESGSVVDKASNYKQATT